jgi:peptidoglycan/xylan/chitin deacetylase (PgdA/CDA1 family)
MTRKLCLTIDVDRDVNECVPGNTAASSLRGGVRFASSEEGTDIILDMLNDIGMEATFFAEARTLENIDVAFGNNEVAMHGLDHEDMTGELSGIVLSDDEIDMIMRTSRDIIKERAGTAPKGFRAPYMRTNEKIMDILPKFGVRYDSSLYSELAETMRPYAIRGGMTEIPVPAAADGNGKRITGYLWPMHEGTRTANEYVTMSQTMKEGVLVIATHSWHMVESRKGGVMDAAEKGKNAENVRKVISGIIDGGYKAVRMSEIIG